MPKYAIFDTETTGLFNFRAPADDPSQPRLASFAAILTDEELNVTDSFKLFAKPDGWEMQAEAGDVNKLTTEHLDEHGVPVSEILDRYTQLIDEGYIMVAFNAQFDLKMMRGELRRAERDDRFEDTPNLCVMRACTDICCVPRAKGNGYKFPKLSEACAHFEIVNEDEHDAMGDAQAAFEIFLKLYEMDALPEAKVHYAKTQAA